MGGMYTWGPSCRGDVLWGACIPGGPAVGGCFVGGMYTWGPSCRGDVLWGACIPGGPAVGGMFCGGHVYLGAQL